MPGLLEARGSERGSAAFSERKKSNVVGKRSGGDQRKVSTDRIRKERLAEMAEGARAAAFLREL